MVITYVTLDLILCLLQLQSAGDPGPSINGKGFYYFSADRHFILIDFVHLFTCKNWCPLKREAD